ncbi:hypothetical protein AgCh_026169 [Apium graveolens]
MVGKNCFGIASDGQLSVQLQAVATDFQKIFRIHDSRLRDLIDVVCHEKRGVRKADVGWPHTDQKRKVVEANQIVILNPYGSENIGRTVTVKGMQNIESAFKAACKILLQGRGKPLFHKFRTERRVAGADATLGCGHEYLILVAVHGKLLLNLNFPSWFLWVI